MVNPTRFDPRADVFGDLVDDLFKGFLVRPMYSGGRGTEQMGSVRVDVAERDGAYLVQAELPGVRKEDIQLSVDGTQVTLTAEIKRERETKEGEQSANERVLHSERMYGKVSRSFTLPQEIDDQSAQAKFADGVLELTLPKKAAAQRKQITIQ
jgi:HSP20 family protein